MNRRGFLAGALALSACSGGGEIVTSAGGQKRMAITMDDFGLGFDVRLDPLARNRKILEAFAAVNHKAAGFITGSFVESEIGKTILRSWGEAGHILANHTWLHKNSAESETSDIQSDILKNHDFLKDVQGFKPYFRFPFLAEGRDAAQLADYRAFLKQAGYREAPVTIDTIDWYVTSRLEKRLDLNPEYDVSGYRDYYVSACVKLAEHGHALAQSLGLENLPHLVLMHHNILNGLFLKDVLLALQKSGWEFVDAEQALAHEFYQNPPVIPAFGRSVLDVHRQVRGLPAFPYPKEYRSFGEKMMDALGL